jgi:hypothetical protein
MTVWDIVVALVVLVAFLVGGTWLYNLCIGRRTPRADDDRMNGGPGQ